LLRSNETLFRGIVGTKCYCVGTNDYFSFNVPLLAPYYSVHVYQPCKMCFWTKKHFLEGKNTFLFTLNLWSIMEQVIHTYWP